MDLDQAIAAHAEWKLKFRSALMNHETMDVTTIRVDTCCNLGKWLHGEGQRRFGSLASFAKLVRNHADFHREAGRIAELINAKDFEAAAKQLDNGSNYASSSHAVALAILALKSEVGHLLSPAP